MLNFKPFYMFFCPRIYFCAPYAANIVCLLIYVINIDDFRFTKLLYKMYFLMYRYNRTISNNLYANVLGDFIIQY